MYVLLFNVRLSGSVLNLLIDSVFVYEELLQECGGFP